MDIRLNDIFIEIVKYTTKGLMSPMNRMLIYIKTLHVNQFICGWGMPDSLLRSWGAV